MPLLAVKIFSLGQHPLSKTFIDFLKDQSLEEQKFACKFPSNPLILVGPTFQFYVFTPLEVRARLWWLAEALNF